MDINVHNIKTFVSLAHAPERHTAHKTMRAQYVALGGLLNVPLMAVDFTNYRETGCLFLFISYRSGYRLDYSFFDSRLIYLSTWQCYIAKYP